ncbi:MAG TPA: phosphoribosylformylglycinamidine synthase, partial [Desulfosalsimonadaceae bacterium]|nr:phosphoribosylformylglycinamidine synthase [Desulfosalsimonadaceae bacterium]
MGFSRYAGEFGYMAHRLEITLKPELFDAEGEGVRKKAAAWFDLPVQAVRTVHVLTIDAELSGQQLERIRQEIFTNPVTQISSYAPLSVDFDWCVWVGYRPGVRDNPGSTAVEAIEDVLEIHFPEGAYVYTSRRYCICGPQLERADAELIAKELLSNEIIQQVRLYSAGEWDPEEGIGLVIPKVYLDHRPTVAAIGIDSDAALQRISDERNLALNPADIPVIRQYFLDSRVKADREPVGLSDPTDVELEYISQARSDHCNHNTFQGLFRYRDADTGKSEVIDNLFQTFIQKPTLALAEKKDWVVSVLWDNAGVGRFDKDHYYVITGETHNSPSNMEA